MASPALCDPIPDPLQPVLGFWAGPDDGIQSRLACKDIGLSGIPELGPLENLPEEIEAEVDGYSDIIGDESIGIPTTCNGVEAITEDDQAEEDQGGPGQIRLEGRLENKGVAVDILGFQGFVELDVRHTDRAPGEETRDGCQVLEPFECLAGSRRTSRQLRQTRNGDSGDNAVVWHAGL